MGAISLESLNGLAYFAWLAAGVIFCAMEALAPGLFLLWIGIAAIAMGIVVFFVPLGFGASLIAFSAFAILAMLIGRRFYGSVPLTTDAPHLNERVAGLVGQTFTLATDIAHGEGRLKVHDSIWRVRGPDALAGARVRVTGIAEDGNQLIVEPV